MLGSNRNMDLWSWLCFECAVTAVLTGAFLKSGILMEAVATDSAVSASLVVFVMGMLSKPLARTFEPYFHTM
jgi:hypothetical protein